MEKDLGILVDHKLGSQWWGRIYPELFQGGVTGTLGREAAY